MNSIIKGTKGKKVPFSQAVLGESSKRSTKPSVGRIVVPSVGTVDENPPRKKKRIY
jgi:hypothetical protein